MQILGLQHLDHGHLPRTLGWVMGVGNIGRQLLAHVEAARAKVAASGELLLGSTASTSSELVLGPSASLTWTSDPANVSLGLIGICLDRKLGYMINVTRFFILDQQVVNVLGYSRDQGRQWLVITELFAVLGPDDGEEVGVNLGDPLQGE